MVSSRDSLLALVLLVLLVGVFSIPVPQEGLGAVGSAQPSSLTPQENLERIASIEGLGDGQSSRGKRTIGPYREIFPELTRNPDVNLLTAAESRISEVRIPFEGFPENFAVGVDPAAVEETKDQEASASGGNNVVDPVEDAQQSTNNGDNTVPDDENRNKRFLNFGLSGSANANSGSGGGSGNFIFDIIRLFAGSGQTESGDEASNSATATAAKSVEKDDAGVPGPITRLFVIANRGLANLIQDLILRLAQTSERIVNFKARLITSII